MKLACRELKEAFRKNEAVCARVVGLFHLFSNKERFRIACLAVRGEFCVNEITEVVSEGRMSNVSQHLKMLTLSGVLQRRRENQRILYSLKDQRVGKMIQFLQEEFLNEASR
ncbi:MAG TPA: metalloregulator ArsR/SmtB family transcription factor [Verrucomicrobiae bacterium]